MGKRILVADDDQALREMMRMALEKEGYHVVAAASGAEARAFLRESSFDLLVTDIYLGDATGLDLLEEARRMNPGTKVILVTAHGTVETASRARQGGAFEYLAKPFRLETLVGRVHSALQTKAQTSQALQPGPESMIIGNHPAIVEVYKAVARVAPLPIPVLIRGETGTGKELVARALHRFGANPEGPFVPINCGAIPESLLESELFGHRRGAFTGAERDRRGAIEQADGGSLFLDEIGELPFGLQAKLLRFLQENEVRPLGSEQTVTVTTRVIAATNRDLNQLISEGKFREDLYFRLATYEILLPPLRERTSDIPALVAHFLERHARRLRLSPDLTADPGVLHVLEGHAWPGNVRELETVVLRALVDHGGLHDSEAIRKLLAPPASAGSSTQRPPAIGDDLTLEELERLHIRAVLRGCGGNRSRAASILGIERKSLYRKARRLGIDLDPEPEGNTPLT